MRQTAVEWLIGELMEKDLLLVFGKPSLDNDAIKIIEQAREMEKVQMIDFAMDYVNSDSIGCLWDGDSAPELDIDTSAEQYYYRTFNTNEK
jgi:hypothetical protein